MYTLSHCEPPTGNGQRKWPGELQRTKRREEGKEGGAGNRGVGKEQLILKGSRQDNATLEVNEEEHST